MSIQELQRRARACPRWFRGVAASLPFLIPLVWVVQRDSPFDAILAWVTSLAGEGADFRHLLSYLLCALPLLLIAGAAIQFVGARRLASAGPDELV